MTQVDRDQIFLLYALTESARALKEFDAICKLAAVRVQRAPGIEVRENQTIFDSLRMALQFSANVSKCFWPIDRSPAKERGERLRALIGVEENHALKLRRLRNHIEHIDERLDAWTAISPRSFSSFEQAIHADVQSWPNLQEIIDSTVVVYMESANSVHLFGEQFLLSDLRASVLDVQNRISNALNPSKTS